MISYRHSVGHTVFILFLLSKITDQMHYFMIDITYAKESRPTVLSVSDD